MPHVFVSYVRQDAELVERLCNSLRENRISVWLDKDNLRPGTRWKRVIRKAIQEGDFFLACFSPNYMNRASTYMNEELTLAIEALRQKSIERAWLIPVILAECDVPDIEIGAGETLLDIQQVRLYEDWDFGINQILSVVKPDETIDGKAPRHIAWEPITVLFLAANPVDTARIRIDEELREIQLNIIEGAFRDRFHIEIRTAVRPQEIGNALVKLRPSIVHFSGHGTANGQLVLTDDSGRSKLVDVGELASLFKLVSHQVKCVVLNFPYSKTVAEAIAEEVDYVIGYHENLGDQAAVIFAASFYQALAVGRTIEDAFELASIQIKLAGKVSSLPSLFKRK